MIVTDLNTLKQVSSQVTEDSGLEAIYAGLEAELNTTSGVGLSAIQINIPLRVCIIRYDKRTYKLYNARIVKRSKESIYTKEGCLSLPNIWDTTKRARHITIRNGNGQLLRFSNMLSVIAQHEIDHWDGVLFTERTV